MSKRPSFQFYPADWSANPNLKRCTFAEKGIWLEVMCLLHDQPEYGVLRWSLQEIATAVKCRPADLRALHRKAVMKGDDQELTAPFVYIPRSGRKDGAPVTLVPAQPGPIWYSSRMVRDEYVRNLRADGGGSEPTKGTPKPAPKVSPDQSPKGGIGVGFGPRGSSSSPSEDYSVPDGTGDGSPLDGLAEFRAMPVETGGWRLALKVLVERGSLSDAKARPLIGKWRSDGLTPEELWTIAEQAWALGTMDPVPYLTKAAAETIVRRGLPGIFDAPPERQRAWMAEYVDKPNSWRPGDRGPRPGHEGCRVSADIQREFGVEPFNSGSRSAA